MNTALPIFEFLEVFCDESPRNGPAQMALDEAILKNCTHPVLRVYRWDGPAVSFGYRQKWDAVAKDFPGVPLVRRWTGGGIVEHGEDWTFALMVPRGEDFAAIRPGESYRLIHEAIVKALAMCGVKARLAGCDECSPGEACFVSPAVYDVLNASGAKLCGGAQRRSRFGLLHQGSLQKTQIPASFLGILGGTLAHKVGAFLPDTPIWEEMERLTGDKYVNSPS